MKRSCFLFAIALSTLTGFSQNLPQIIDYDLGKKDLVIFPFGMDQTIVLGTISKQGEILFDLESINMEEVNNMDLYASDLKSTLQIYCDDEGFGSEESENNVLVANAGDLFIWDGKKWVGVLIPASNEKVKERLLDEWGKDAAEGTYIKWYFSDQEINLKKECTSTLSFGSDELTQKKSYDIRFQPGWNLVKYTILKIAEVEGAMVTPIEIKVESVDNNAIPENIKWYLKKF